MTTSVLILLGKLFSKITKTLNLGNGSTWPGHIALSFHKNFIKEILAKNNLQIVIVAGTNGKTTTASLIQSVLEKNGKRVFQNASGANLLNGIASTLLLESSSSGKIEKQIAIFEVDENALPHVLKQVSPQYLILLDLFRDQLDRYGEVRTIVHNWKESLKTLSPETTLILNADDPQIAHLGSKLTNNTFYFGLNELSLSRDTHEHAVDSIYCPQCGEKLTYKKIYYSHLGEWHCTSCKLKRPHINLPKFSIYPLSGTYNKYNTLAAVLTVKSLGIDEEEIHDALELFTPAFGRQEIIAFENKKVQLFLSKNPTSFNESIKTICEAGAKHILFVLNDRIPDGRDISWIWDTDLPNLQQFENIVVSGDRVYDMALRIKYDMQLPELKSRSDDAKLRVFDNLEEAIIDGLRTVSNNETLYILPTYSAMLEVRKILLGRKVL